MSRRPDPVAVIMAAFPGAREIGPDETCPTCGRVTTPTRDGKRTLCAWCSCREMGTTPYVLALAVEFYKSIKVIEARLEKHGPPHVNPKAWLTARSHYR